MPAEVQGEQTLMWVDGETIYHGECGARLTKREYCQHNLTSKPLIEVEAGAHLAINSDFQRNTAARHAEITKLTAEDATVQALNLEILHHTAELAKLDEELKKLTADREVASATKLAKQEWSDWYAGQLVAVNDALVANPNDRDLLRLREQLMQDKDKNDAAIAELDRFLTLASARSTQVTARAETLRVDLSTAEAALKQYLESLVLRSPALTRLDAELARLDAVRGSLPAVIEMIKKGDLTQRSHLMTAHEQSALSYLAAMVVPMPIMIQAGRYRISGGQGAYCPQSMEPSYERRSLRSIKLNFLAPCNGGMELQCQGYNCSGSTNNFPFLVKIISTHSYELKRGVGSWVLFEREGA